MTLKELRARWPEWWFNATNWGKGPWRASASFDGDNLTEVEIWGSFENTPAEAVAALSAWMDANIKRAEKVEGGGA